MAEPLWDLQSLVAALEARMDTAGGASPSTLDGLSIDTRTLSPGDGFFALTDQRDGHDFVTAAFDKGAAAAIVREGYARRPGDRLLLRVDDPLQALTRLARASRARLSPAARVIAVTGSAGKTGTKEMLRLALQAYGSVHAPEKSFNNHWGVPLTLARMPAETDYAVIEIGMNHAGEITPLTRLARPHITAITNVLSVHLGQFASEEGIAEAKAEILLGLEQGGVAILNRDNRHFRRLAARAADVGARIVSFGADEGADVVARRIEAQQDCSTVEAEIAGATLLYRVGAPGRHLAENSLVVAAALSVLGRDPAPGLAALEQFRAPAGRGERTRLTIPGGELLLIDEGYNANPASVAAALAAMASVPRDRHPRRIAVLGDMLELGPTARELHLGLMPAIDESGVDLVFACGPNMGALFATLAKRRQGAHAARSDELAPIVASALRQGDVVMVKGSLGTRMAPIVAAIKSLADRTEQA